MTRRILLDLTPLSATSALRGIGRYVRGLVQGLSALDDAERYEFQIEGIACDRNLRKVFSVADLSSYCKRPAEAPVWGADWRRNLLVSCADLRINGGGSDLLHLTDPKGLPRRRDYTLTCHDLISLTLPELYLPPLPGWSNLVRTIERVRYTRARRILTGSQATKRDLCELLGLEATRIDVVWYGVDHDRFRPDPEFGEVKRVADAIASDGPYILYLGAGDARKDLETLIRGFAASRSGRSSVLVIAGRLAARERALRKLAHELGVLDRVRFLGYVDESLVPALYRQSRVHVFPSRYEGFGLPVLEALACGAPTITSPGSSLEEVAGDAARIVPCGEVDALCAGLDTLFFDDQSRDALRQQGFLRAREFTWQKCAMGTVRFWDRSFAEAEPGPGRSPIHPFA